MSTQTTEKKATMVPVTFQATGNLRLVRVPVRKMMVGLEHTLTEGLEYVFEPDGPGGKGGKLIVNDALIERDTEFFERNDPKFDGDPRTLDWLRNHKQFGKRFREVPPTPPDPQETLETISAAAARGDEDALAAIFEEEERTFARPQILRPIESALRGIEEARAEREQGDGPPSAEAGAEPGFRPPQPE